MVVIGRLLCALLRTGIIFTGGAGGSGKREARSHCVAGKCKNAGKLWPPMVLIPQETGSGTRGKTTLSNTKQPYFLRPAGLSADGRLRPPLPVVLDGESTEQLMDGADGAAMPDSHAAQDPKQAPGLLFSRLFEASPLYFVLGYHINTTFSVILRKNLSDRSSRTGIFRRQSYFVKPRGPAAASEPSTEKTCATEQSTEKMDASHIFIATPEPIKKLLIANQQILFQGEEAVYIYTPLATSLLPVRAIDFCVDHFLYVLTGEAVLVYGEQLVERIPLDRACERIAAGGGGVFVSAGNFLYKIVDNKIVYSSRFNHAILTMKTDGEFLFLVMNNRAGNILFSLRTADMAPESTYTGGYGASIHMAGRDVVVSNGRTALMYLDKGTLVPRRTELLSCNTVAFTMSDGCKHVLEARRIVSYIYDRAEYKSDDVTDISRPEEQCSSLVEELMRASDQYSLEQELQRLADQSAMGDTDNPVPADDYTPDGSAIGQDAHAKHPDHFASSMRAYARSPASSSSDGPVFFQDDQPAADPQVAQYLSRIAEPCTVQPPSPCIVRPPNPYHIEGIPVSNPPTQPLYATSRPSADGRSIVTRLSRPHAPYKRSLFFVRSHFNWFYRHFRRLLWDHTEVPQDFPVYGLLLRRLAEAEQAARPKAKAAAPRSTSSQPKQKRGGF